VFADRGHDSAQLRLPEAEAVAGGGREDAECGVAAALGIRLRDDADARRDERREIERELADH
jgi:hypothetical protein